MCFPPTSLCNCLSLRSKEPLISHKAVKSLGLLSPSFVPKLWTSTRPTSQLAAKASLSHSWGTSVTAV